MAQRDVEAVAQLAQVRDRIYQEIGKVIIGQREIVEQLLVSLLAGGHCLLIGVPGLAKTMLSAPWRRPWISPSDASSSPRI